MRSQPHLPDAHQNLASRGGVLAVHDTAVEHPGYMEGIAGKTIDMQPRTIVIDPRFLGRAFEPTLDDLTRPDPTLAAGADLEAYLTNVHEKLGIREGQAFGNRYRVERILGNGGMAAVFLASPIGNAEKKTAIKVAVPCFEDKLAGESDHYAVLEEIDAPLFPKAGRLHVDENGLYYLPMDYIDGVSLSKYIDGKRALSLPNIIEIMLQLCGLNIFHNLGWLHGDIKPCNVMLVDEGGKKTVKVIDFGIASQIGENRYPGAGTPAYMPPEQLRQEVLDQRVDIYALGIIFYEMITGRNPMISKSDEEAIEKQLQTPMPALTSEDVEEKVSPALWNSLRGQIGEVTNILRNLIQKMTQKDKNERFVSLEEIVPLLRQAQALAEKIARYEAEAGVTCSCCAGN